MRFVTHSAMRGSVTCGTLQNCFPLVGTIFLCNVELLKTAFYWLLQSLELVKAIFYWLSEEGIVWNW